MIKRLSLGLRNLPGIGGLFACIIPTPRGCEMVPFGDNILVAFGLILGKSTLCSEAFEVITYPSFFLGFFCLRPSMSQKYSEFGLSLGFGAPFVPFRV